MAKRIDASFRPIKRPPDKKPLVNPKRINYYGDGYSFEDIDCEDAYETEDGFSLTDEDNNCLNTE